VLEITSEKSPGVIGLGRTDGNVAGGKGASVGSESDMVAAGKAACNVGEFGGVIINGRLLKVLIGNVKGDGCDEMLSVA